MSMIARDGLCASYSLGSLLTLTLLASPVFLTPTLAAAMDAPGDAELIDVTVDRSSGASSLSLPVEAPHGTGGFAPQLSLAYSSRSSDSAFGVGWQLAGLSAIEWSTRRGVPAYTTYDPSSFQVDERFELDGQPLLWNGAESR